MKILILFASFLLFTCTLKAEIIEINNLSEIRDKFVELQQDYPPNGILVIFAIKDVILKPLNPEFRKQDDGTAHLLKKMFKQAKLNNFIYLDEIILTNYKHELLDKIIPQLIKEIINKGTPVIAMTEYITGNFNKINRFEVWFDQYLNKFDISFADSYKENNDITFNKLKPYFGTYPVYYNGILHSNKTSKDQTFMYFLTNLTLIPKIIIMVDNNPNSLQNMENQIKSYSNDIIFIGYSYKEDIQEDDFKITDKDLIKFWSNLIEKINNVKRINSSSKSSEDPYDK